MASERFEYQSQLPEKLRAIGAEYEAGNITLEEAQQQAASLQAGTPADEGPAGGVTRAVDRVTDIATGKAATDAEKDAAKANKEIADQTLAQQKEIYGEVKAEILQANKDLIEYAESKGLDIENLLLNSDNEAFRVSMDTLRDAKDQDLAGNAASSSELLQGIDNAVSIFEESKQNYTPWMEAGQLASQELIDRADELTRQFTLDDFEVDPGYQFRLEQGQESIINRASSLGVTGNTIKDIVEYSQNVASDEYGKARNRFVDWQKGATDYYSNISDRGFTAADRITGINRDLASAATDKGTVRAIEEENKSNILSDFITDSGARTSQNILNQAGIKSSTIDRNIGRREGITREQGNQLVGLAGGNVNALANYSVSAQNANTQYGQAEANRYNNLRNLGTDMVKNYLFLKYSGAGGGGNTVSGTGSQPVQNVFAADPNNMGYQSPYS